MDEEYSTVKSIEPEGHRGELRLWNAVVLQLIRDALSSNDRSDSTGRAMSIATNNTAIAMLDATYGRLYREFEWLCGLAGLCPHWIRKQYKIQRDLGGYRQRFKKCRQ